MTANDLALLFTSGMLFAIGLIATGLGMIADSRHANRRRTRSAKRRARYAAATYSRISGQRSPF